MNKIPNMLLKKLKECENFIGYGEDALLNYLSAIYDGGCSAPTQTIIDFLLNLIVGENKTLVLSYNDEFEFANIKNENHKNKLFKMLILILEKYIEKNKNKIMKLFENKGFQLLLCYVFNDNNYINYTDFMRALINIISTKISNENDFEKIVDILIQLPKKDDNVNSNFVLRALNSLLINIKNENLVKIIANKTLDLYAKPSAYLRTTIDNEWLFKYLDDDNKKKLLNYVNDLYEDELVDLIDLALKNEKIDDIKFKYIITASEILLDKSMRYFMLYVIDKIFNSKYFNNKQIKIICDKIFSKFVKKIIEDDKIDLFKLYYKKSIFDCKNIKLWAELIAYFINNNECELAEYFIKEILHMDDIESFVLKFSGLLKENDCYRVDDFLDVFDI